MNLVQRVAKIEAESPGKVQGRIFSLVGGDGSLGEAMRFLAEQGYEATTRDLILHRPVFKPSDDGPQRMPVSLAFRIDSRLRHEDALAELR